jgi:DNA-binding MarR family transcriptional regulator
MYEDWNKIRNYPRTFLHGSGHDIAMDTTPDKPLIAAPHVPGREAGLSHDDHQAVRLWLRLLTCSTQIEQVIRSNLRTQFGTTLPRFDYLAQLSRFPKGLRMKTLSEYLMVTGGNITGLTDQLVAEGWVERVADGEDRRAMIIRMTRSGKKQFSAMAQAHEQWLEQLLAPLGAATARELYAQLGQLRQTLAQTDAAASGAEDS